MGAVSGFLLTEGKMRKASPLQKLLDPNAKKEVEELYGPRVGLRTGEKPLYLQAAEARAQRMGISPQELLERYSRRLKESKYPTPECFPVDRVQAYASGSSLSEIEKNHLTVCEGCCQQKQVCTFQHQIQTMYRSVAQKKCCTFFAH